MTVKFPASPTFYQNLVLADILLFTNLMDMKQHLVDLNCKYLITSEVKHHFMCLLVIWVSF